MDRKKIERFEDLIIWQKARALTCSVYDLTGKPPLVRDFGLRDQLRRSAVSIMSNIAEGFERSSPREYANFLNIAKASCAELRSQLYIVEDTEAVSAEIARSLRSEALTISRMTAALLARVRANQRE